MGIFYVDGNFVDADDSGMPFDDLGLLRGYGVFDFLRTYGGKPFLLDAHLKRLIRSASQIGIAVPWSLSQLEKIVDQTLERNHFDESHIRILITGGGSQDFITPSDNPRLLVMVTPLIALPKEWYQTGIKIITTPHERFLPTAKTINYIPAIMALNTAKQQGAVEAVYITDDGRVLEGTTSNLFAFIDGCLATPETDVLAGVTRQVVLDIAQPLFDVQLRELHIDVLKNASEVFLSSSNKEVIPVTQIDSHTVADGRPGPQTQQMMTEFAKFTAAYSQSRKSK